MINYFNYFGEGQLLLGTYQGEEELILPVIPVERRAKAFLLAENVEFRKYREEVEGHEGVARGWKRRAHQVLVDLPDHHGKSDGKRDKGQKTYELVKLSGKIFQNFEKKI